MSDLVGNPEDRFSQHTAHFIFSMDQLEEAIDCFVVDGMESTLMEYLMNQPYISMIIQALSKYNVTITSSSVGFDDLMYGMMAYCDALDGK